MEAAGVDAAAGGGAIGGAAGGGDSGTAGAGPGPEQPTARGQANRSSTRCRCFMDSIIFDDAPNPSLPGENSPVPRLARFLPKHVVAEVSREGPTPTIPRARREPAALLLTDISGFTRLAESLHRTGPEGAEQVALLADRVMRPAIAAILEHRGSVAAFAGDAVLSLFHGARAVRSAEAAAASLATAVPETIAGQRVAVHQGIHYAAVRHLHLGSPDRRHALLTGPAVAAVSRHQAEARPGEVRLTRAARRRRRSEPRLKRLPAVRLRLPASRLRSFFPPHLTDELGRTSGQLKTASVLFIETRTARLPELQRFFLALDATLTLYGGTLLKSDSLRPRLPLALRVRRPHRSRERPGEGGSVRDGARPARTFGDRDSGWSLPRNARPSRDGHACKVELRRPG